MRPKVPKHDPMASRQFRLSTRQLKQLQLLVKRGDYPTLSEAVRDAVRQLIEIKEGRR